MTVTWLTNPGSLAEPKELAHTVSETWTNEKMSATASLICPWADRHGVLSNILLNQKEWPYLPGTGIFAVDGAIAPFDGSVNSNATISAPADFPSGNDYIDAKVNVNFEFAIQTGNGPGGGTAIYSESLEATAEYLTLPFKGFYWKAAPVRAVAKEEMPGRLEIGCDYTVTWNGLTRIPTQALTLIGCVNNAPVFSPSLELTFPAETLLFNPPKISRTINAAAPGQPNSNRFQMVVRLTYRANGWNQFWRADVSKYDQMAFGFNKAPYNNFKLAAMGGVLP